MVSEEAVPTGSLIKNKLNHVQAKWERLDFSATLSANVSRDLEVPLVSNEHNKE